MQPVQRKKIGRRTFQAPLCFLFQRTDLSQKLNKNQESKPEPASTFGFGLLLWFLAYDLLRYNLLPLCFSLRFFISETREPFRLTKAGVIHRASLREWVVDEEGGLGRRLLVISLTAFRLTASHQKTQRPVDAAFYIPLLFIRAFPHSASSRS